MIQTIAEARSTLAPVFARYGVSRAVLFGSLAKGTATAKSDLDLLVASNLRGLRFVDFMEAVRQAAGRPVDVLDVSHIEENSAIQQEIQSTGVTIYEKPDPH
ncbi:MAG TPA: nucleotidyltransferase domain-containing protein [Candidatus Evtepia faecavium]|nr:nucleotidyltransferase domain-containing protein [Candidatus Evtepia faecavium]